MRSVFAVLVAAGMSACATSTPYGSDSTEPAHISAPHQVFVIGQDLDTIRGYYASDCCISAAAVYLYRNSPRSIPAALSIC